MKLLRSLHAWVGVVLALVLALVGLTGAVSVFRSEVVRATVPAARVQAPAPASFGPALDRLQATGVKIRSVKFSPYGLGVHSVLFAGGAGFVDGEGRLVQRWTRQARIEDTVLALHHTLLAGEGGEQVLGVVGLFGITMVLSGLVIWIWPKPRLHWLVWPASTKRRDLMMAHLSLGPILAVFLLFQLTTGAGMALQKFARPLLHATRPPPPKAAPAADPPSWSQVLAAAQAVYPDAIPRRAVAPFRRGGTYAVFLQQPGDLNPEGGATVYVDGHGEVIGKADQRDLGPGVRLFNTLLGLHSGAWAGTAGRLLTTVTGVGLAMLSLMGALAFLKRKRPTR
jgi:uncharacterized iron-regulated membrane protein